MIPLQVAVPMSGPGARGRRTRKRAAVGTAVFVLLLAGVILVVSALSSPVSDVEDDLPGVTALTREERSQVLLGSALDAVAAGDTTTAVRLLEQALQVDPLNTEARDELVRLSEMSETDDGSDDQAGQDDPAGGTDPIDEIDPDEGFMEPAEDIRDLLPSAVGGFARGVVGSGPDDAEVTFDPTWIGPYDRVMHALAAVHDRGTVEDAESFLENVSRHAFAIDARELTLGGLDAYFGTNGDRLATVAFRRGRFVFEVIVTVAPGVDPSSVVDVATTVAEAYPGSL